MVDGNSDGDPKEVAEIRHSQSPWKKPPSPQSLRDCSLMGFDTESWPALTETHNLNVRPKHCCSSSSNALSSPAAKLLTPDSPSVNSNQGANGNPIPLKQSGSSHRRFGPKNEPNGAPPFPAPIPHQHPPSPHIVYPRGPLRLPGDESLPPMQPFIPVFNLQPRVRGFSNYDTPPRPFPNDSSRHFINLRPIIRPPFVGPSPGFMTGPVFPGPEMHFLPVSPPPPLPIRSPPIVVNSPTTLHPLDTPQLRSNIVKQVEYYFSEENMVSDHYLKSLMNNQGWVLISSIADFKRVKSMTTNISLILDALQSSKELEIHDGKVRNRNSWSKWVQMNSASNEREESLKEASSAVREENGSNESGEIDEAKGNLANSNSSEGD